MLDLALERRSRDPVPAGRDQHGHRGGSLELAVRRLTFDSASAFGIYDRGLVQPGMAADLVAFDADTVKPVAEDVVHDFPNDGWRMRELAEGITSPWSTAKS